MILAKSYGARPPTAQSAALSSASSLAPQLSVYTSMMGTDAMSHAWSADDETTLIQLAKQNPALFAPVYEHYFDRVYAYCIHRVHDTQEAEDLCSQIFAKVLTGLHTYRDGVFAAWLFGIAHNVLVDYYHKRRPSEALVPIDELELAGEDETGHWDQAADLATDGVILQQIMQTLTDEQRDLLAMSLEADLTSQEIGVVVGKSAGAVRVQLHRIFKQLRKHYLKLTGEDA